jgi:CubicO group peptidase (beta-lactamase class C family)
VDAHGIGRFVDAVEGSSAQSLHSLMIVRHGCVVAAAWWEPYAADRRQLLYSLSKSFTATALGVALGQGLVCLDDPVLAYFPEWDSEVDARVGRILVRHVASMASGHTEDMWLAALTADSADPVRGFLHLPPAREPGSVFAYNQPATHTLATILQRATGQTLTQYLHQHVLGPLGAEDVNWVQYPAGQDIGFTGLHATTATVALLGQLYLQRGRWHDQQLLSQQWVAEATSGRVPTSPRVDLTEGAPRPDWEQGYGYQFWVSRHGYRGDGAYGQFCLVLPDQDAVVAITSESLDTQELLGAAWEHLLPAFSPTHPLDGAADRQLADRLSSLAVPSFEAAAQPGTGAARWADVVFSPATGQCLQQPSLLQVKVSADDGAWRLSLQEAEHALTGRFTAGTWTVDEVQIAPGEVVPIACTGGWTGPARLRVDVIFLETPHRLVLTCRLEDLSFDARWATVPLHAASLSHLRAPRPVGAAA